MKKNTRFENQFESLFFFPNSNSKWLVLGGFIFASHQSPNSGFIFRNSLWLISVLCSLFSLSFLSFCLKERMQCRKHCAGLGLEAGSEWRYYHVLLPAPVHAIQSLGCLSMTLQLR